MTPEVRHGRFLSYLTVREGDCWEWRAQVEPKGYGRFRFPGGSLAHIYAYVHYRGPYPEGMQLDHLCHTWAGADCPGGHTCMHRRCVNPDHLEPVSPRENVLRSHGLAAANAQKTHCPLGHELKEGNLRPGRYRKCATCWQVQHRESQRRYVQRKREASGHHS